MGWREYETPVLFSCREQNSSLDSYSPNNEIGNPFWLMRVDTPIAQKNISDLSKKIFQISKNSEKNSRCVHPDILCARKVSRFF
jgi:hypothetical protein